MFFTDDSPVIATSALQAVIASLAGCVSYSGQFEPAPPSAEKTPEECAEVRKRFLETQP